MAPLALCRRSSFRDRAHQSRNNVTTTSAKSHLDDRTTKNHAPKTQSRVPGQQRQKTSGASWARARGKPTVGPPRDPRPGTNRLVKGDYYNGVHLVEDRRAPAKQDHLTKDGKELLAQYYKRVIFMQAIRDGSSIAWAGWEFLGARKSSASDIKREIEECGGVDDWFRVEALRKMARGKIGRGRETLKSPVADAFFTRLIGGGQSWNDLQARFGNTGVVDAPATIHKEPNVFNREVLGYMIGNWIFGELKDE